MQSAFALSVPLPTTHARHHVCLRQQPGLRTRRPRRPRMTAEPPPSVASSTPSPSPSSSSSSSSSPSPAPAPDPLPTPSPIPPPLQRSSHLEASPLLSALYDIFSARVKPEEALAFLPNDVEWRNPLVDLTVKEIPEALNSFLSFAVDPTLCVHAIHHTSFQWSLSFTYPLPWRPRVNVSGTTRVDSFTRPTRIVDHWLVPPMSLIGQSLPTLPDIIWLWPAPHAETDAGHRRVLKRASGYRIVRFAPIPELRCIGPVQDFERELAWATPTLPEQAFEGGLRRREKYSTVSPISVRQIDDATFEWAVPVPGMFVGSATTLLPAPSAENITVEATGDRIMAVRRFGGFSTATVVKERLAKFIKSLKEDNIIKEDVPSDRVWVKVYDTKVGFNSRGKLAMAMYGSSTGVPRRNEIAIDLTGIIPDDFDNQ